MSVSVVFQQMVMMFLLMGLGFFLAKKRVFSAKAPKDLSKMIAEVCNPALIICSAFEEGGTATERDLLFAALIAVIYYVILIGIGYVIPRVIRAKKSEVKFYRMLSVYSNIGFIGIPVISAVMGGGAIIYLTVFIIVFNLLIYTHGIKVLTGEGKESKSKLEWRRMINPGTMASVIAITLFLSDITFPKMLEDTLVYVGRCTTFLSMAAIGMVLAGISLRTLFSVRKLYAFAAIRYILIPVVAAFCLKPILTNELLLGVTILTLALPAGNLPLILAEQYNVETELLAKGTVLTTILSIISLTVASWVLLL